MSSVLDNSWGVLGWAFWIFQSWNSSKPEYLQHTNNATIYVFLLDFLLNTTLITLLVLFMMRLFPATVNLFYTAHDVIVKPL